MNQERRSGRGAIAALAAGGVAVAMGLAVHAVGWSALEQALGWSDAQYPPEVAARYEMPTTARYRAERAALAARIARERTPERVALQAPAVSREAAGRRGPRG